ncbi:MAG: glycosyl hydrolase [Bacteroidota bacterium]|nr:glycosyl hydrolase [Bacteroidota bacterium]
MKKILLSVLFIFFTTYTLNSQTKINSATFGALNARQIGSASMSGRITAIDAVNIDPRIVFVGTAGGGVWKTLNGGAVFKSVFDKYCQSIGALAIDQNKPDVIWVGTGESNMRNSVAIGDGMYLSDDGGDNWKKVGLENSEHISKIVIHPEKSNVVYAAVPGALWGDSEDRGLYKTTDGGNSWNKILYIDDKTGCADIVMDPKNPKILYASMWQFRRKPYAFASGGENSGLYKSVDGGENWDRIDKSFTDDNKLGRICIAVSPGNTDHIYAIAESKNTGLFESLDAGKTWKRNSASADVVYRPFYFSVIAIDPTDENRVYRPAFNLNISDDGGQSFRTPSFEGGFVHPDYHAIWINPKNPQQIYVGTDGGVYMSLDRGNNFMFIHNLPVSQFYHASYDLEKPYYNVYGGLQDNGSWYAPSSTPGGIDNDDWVSFGGGDGFSVIPDLTNSDYVYWEFQGGNIRRYNKKNFEDKDVKPQPMKGEEKLRCNWNTPIFQSTLNPGTIYLGSQYLFKTNDKGETWQRISPDLTTNDPEKQKQEESGGLSIDNSSAENHCTIFAICDSPVDANIIWVGTDDGNVQVSENGGVSWNNVVENIPKLPKNTWVSSIDASSFDRSTAFATFDGHAGGDKKAYVYKTTDMGKTWTLIATDEISGYAHKVKQDIVNPNLLFVGTVFGLYISIDGGKVWAQYTGNIPKCEVRDISIQPEKGDLILATHGRGIIILDDLTPIRNITTDVLEADAYLLPTRANYNNGINLGSNFFPFVGMYVGQNAPEDAVIVYYLKDRVVTGEVKVDIYNNSGTLLKSLPGTKRKGVNRVTWDMKLKPPKVAPGVTPDRSGFFGPSIDPGTYIVKLTKGDKTYTGNLEIIQDPNSPYGKEDIALRNETTMKIFKMHEDLAYVVHNINTIKEETKKLVDDGKLSKDSGDELINKLEDLRKTCVATSEAKGITGEERLKEKISELYTSVIFYGGKPTQQQVERITGLEFELQKTTQQADEIYKNYLDKVNAELKAKGMNEIDQISREDFDKLENKKSS